MALIKGMQSFSSIATMTTRWNQFINFIHDEFGIGRMERIERRMIENYGLQLAKKVKGGEMSPQTAQTYISAVNRVLQISRGDRDIWVSPTKDCGIARRSGIARVSRAMNIEVHFEAITKVSERVGILMELQRLFGLRFEESAKFDARRALKEAMKFGVVTISYGTKGGRTRVVPINPENFNMQIFTLERAVFIQSADRSMIPSEQSYKYFQRCAYQEAKRAGVRFHAERHAYAQQRYSALVGAQCPVAAGVTHGREHLKYLVECLSIPLEKAKEIDLKARKQITEELGHSRIGVTNAYIG